MKHGSPTDFIPCELNVEISGLNSIAQPAKDWLVLL